jgi:hypothetical protein
VRLAVWSTVATLVFASATAATAGDPETYANLIRALNGIAEKSTPQSLPSSDRQGLVGFRLVGVVIAGERRLALVQPEGTTSANPQVLPIGAVMAGYRLAEIEEEQVTLVGQRGERTILRLQTGGGVGSPTP